MTEATTGNLFFDLLIWINLFGYYLLGIMIPGIYYIWIKIFSFSLITRKSHELLIIISPEKITIKKIKSRLYPFFRFKKGLYWFATPIEDTDNDNKYHIYLEGINQSLNNMKRRENKLDELTTNTERINEIGPHQIYLPKNLKGHMHKHYEIVLDLENNRAKIRPTTERQSLRLSFYHTVGIVIEEKTEKLEEIEQEQTTGSQKVILTNLSSQTIINKIKFIQEYTYFSSYSAFYILRKIRRANMNFTLWVKGTIDPKVILILVLMLGGIALTYFGIPLMMPKLGPMPTN